MHACLDVRTVTRWRMCDVNVSFTISTKQDETRRKTLKSIRSSSRYETNVAKSTDPLSVREKSRNQPLIRAMSVLGLRVKAGYNAFAAFACRTERDESAYLHFASNAYMSCLNRFDDDCDLSMVA